MTFHKFDDASAATSYVAVGATGRCLRLSSSAFALIQARQAGLSYEDISLAMSPANRVPSERLTLVGETLLKTLAMVDSQPAPKPPGFVVSATVIPARLTIAIGKRLTGLYAPRFAGSIALLLAATLATHPTLAGRFTMSDAVVAYFIFLLSIVFHEFGHSCACLNAGVEPGDIGAAIYIVYPAMYSDVSCAWRLPRHQRVLVDLGGNYFQAIFALACFWLFRLTGWQPLRGAVLLIMAAIAVSLNPLLRFDGYWVLSDLLGVPNLLKESRRAVAQHTARLFRNVSIRQRWSSGTTALVVVYGLASLSLWTWFMFRIWPRMLWRRIVGYPHAVLHMIAPFRDGLVPRAVDIAQFVWTTLLLIAALIIVWRCGASLFQLTFPWLRRLGRFISGTTAAVVGRATQTRERRIDAAAARERAQSVNP